MAGKQKLKNKLKNLRKPKVVVGGEQAVMAPNSKYTSPRRRKMQLAGYAFVAIIIIWVGVALLHSQISASNTRTKLVNQAADVLKTYNYTDLQPIVVQVEQQSGYEKDSSCLYVLTVYYANITDSSDTKNSYDLLKKSYDQKKGYSNKKLRTTDPKTPAELAQVVDYVVNQASQAKTNTDNLSPR